MASISTDFEGEQLTGLDRSLRRLGVEPRGLEEQARTATRTELGVDWDRDVRPLLGNRIVVGIPTLSDTPPYVIALEVKDRERLLRLAFDIPTYLEPAGEASGARLFRTKKEVGGGLFAVKNDELVFAGSRATLDAALRRRDAEEVLTPETFDARAGEVSGDSFVRAYLLTRSVPQELRNLGLGDARSAGRVPWIAAIRTFGLAVGASRETLDLEVAAATDPTGLSPEELPLAPGDASPGVLASGRDGSMSVRDPARIALFWLDALEASGSDRGLQRSIARDQRLLDIDLRRDVLAQLHGDSAFTTAPNSRGLARFVVRDPPALARTLQDIAKGLPKLSSRSPLGTGVEGARVDRIDGERDLYRLSSGRGRIAFGLLDGVLVYGTERYARAVVKEPLVEVANLDGALVFRADAREAVGFVLDARNRRALGDLTGSVNASTRRVRLTVRQAVR